MPPDVTLYGKGKGMSFQLACYVVQMERVSVGLKMVAVILGKGLWNGAASEKKGQPAADSQWKVRASAVDPQCNQSC